MATELFEEPLADPRGSGADPRTAHAVILENPWIRAALVPESDGRLLSLIDKRTGRECLGPEGLRINFLSRESVVHRAAGIPASAEREVSEAILFGLSHNHDASWHVRWSLSNSDAVLHVSVALQNRSMLETLEANPRIEISAPDATVTTSPSGVAVVLPEGPSGVIVSFPEGTIDAVKLHQDQVHLLRGEHTHCLRERQTDAWSFSVAPTGDLARVDSGSPTVALHVEQAHVRIQSTRRLAEHRLFVLTADGKSFDAPVDLYPETSLLLSFSDLPSAVTELLLTDSNRNELLRWSSSAAWLPSEQRFTADVQPLQRQESPHWRRAKAAFAKGETAKADLLRARRDLTHRPVALLLEAAGAAREREFHQSVELLEEALGSQSDDALAWWAKAVLHRAAQTAEAEQPELLNAHFIAPLEPALRAEAWFRGTHEPTGQPNPLLTPLVAMEGSFESVACLLLELGLYEDAVRWIDEALRHADRAMLRYLLADALIAKTRMAVDAATHIAMAAQLPPPRTCRLYERLALMRLSEAFPSDRRLIEITSGLPLPDFD